MTDAEVLNAIATYLGTSDDWNAGDVCELVAELVAVSGRPHPGVGDGAGYVDRMVEAGYEPAHNCRQDIE